MKDSSCVSFVFSFQCLIQRMSIVNGFHTLGLSLEQFLIHPHNAEVIPVELTKL